MRKKSNDAAGIRHECKAVGEAREQQILWAESSLIRKHGILVHHGTARSTIDAAEFINRQRNFRIRRWT